MTTNTPLPHLLLAAGILGTLGGAHLAPGHALGSAASLLAQEPPRDPPPETRLDEEDREDLFEYLNAPGTLLIPGSITVPEGTRLGGDVAILGGNLVLGGRVEGHLVVVNGDLTFEPGARVEGDVRVVGGSLEGPEAGQVEGQVEVYDEPLRYERRDDQIVERTDDVSMGRSLEVEAGRVTGRLSVRAGTNYNRVEGLPVQVGPLVDTGGRNPLRVTAFAVWRSVGGLDLSRDDLGYDVQARQSVGGRQRYAVGAGVHSEIVPVEAWGISDVEASLSTFLLRRDFRDYYEREGWRAFIEYAPYDSPVELQVEYRDDRHHFAPIRNAWALRDEDDRPWRAQPMVGEGTFRSAGLALTLDRRNDPDRPSDGWLLEGRFRAGLGGSLALPRHEPLDDEGNAQEPVDGPAVDHDVSFGLVDARRYLRLSPSSMLAVRGIMAGSLAGGVLPPQFQTALGGIGSVPGRDPLQGDCGARDAEAVLPDRGSEDGQRAYAGYGCDRLALLQAEYRGRFPTRWSPLPDAWSSEEWAGALDLQPRWSFFANVGRGWSLGEGVGPGTRTDTDTMADVGAGLYLGALGVYATMPVTGQQRRPGLFVRLTHRF